MKTRPATLADLRAWRPLKWSPDLERPRGAVDPVRYRWMDQGWPGQSECSVYARTHEGWAWWDLGWFVVEVEG